MPADRDALQLVLWREACRHIDMAGFLETVAPVLARQVPADLFAIRTLAFERQAIETVAIAGAGASGVADGAGGRTPCAPAAFRQVVDWCAQGSVRRGDSRDPVLQLLTIGGAEHACLAGPLAVEGVLGVFVAQAAKAFDPEHDAIVGELLEPLGVALANDSRFRELVRLREALEADKRALLSRLGRQQVADTIVGADGGLREVMERVDQVAPTDVPVLLLGETGTGKEVIARTIHARSPRAHAPIMRVNCGALPPGLIDSELFGHERGSFTGAVDSRKGWFERADGGTLFLDEIGELPLDAQVRLLRILQDGTYQRVGAHRTLHADVRIVAATHRDLREMVDRGAFREDLWYRLAVFPIHLPPIRDRVEDIPALVRHLAAKTGIRLGGRPLVPTREDVELLLGYSWPGNVRELGAVIERAGILGNGRSLQIAAALGATATKPAGRSAARAHQPRGAPDAATGTLDHAMARHIERALIESYGRIEGPLGAAARLGINPHTLRARMRKLRIDWKQFRPPARPRSGGAPRRDSPGHEPGESEGDD